MHNLRRTLLRHHRFAWLTAFLAALPAAIGVSLAATAASGSGSVGAEFAVPASPRATYNFNPGWKFAFGDVAGADQPAFDDSAWSNVSLPHTWNETDTYRTYISHGGGDVGEKMMGIGWYPADVEDGLGAEMPQVFSGSPQSIPGLVP